MPIPKTPESWEPEIKALAEKMRLEERRREEQAERSCAWLRAEMAKCKAKEEAARAAEPRPEAEVRLERIAQGMGWVASEPVKLSPEDAAKVIDHYILYGTLR